MTVEQKLRELGITLPAAPAPAGAYVPAVNTGKLVYVSGQLPLSEGKVVHTGKVGGDQDLPQAQQAARLCAINALAALKGHLGDLEQIKRIVRVEVFVNSAPGFTAQARVADGASQLFAEVFGEKGKHTRLAVGAAELPLNAAVELALITEIY